jgi:hypothetical protein
MLVRMQIQQELNQRPLQLRAPVGEENESAAGKLGRARKIHQPQTLADLDMGPGLETELRLLAVDADDGIVLRCFAHGN